MTNKIETRDIPMEQIYPDEGQPRRDLGVPKKKDVEDELEDNRLFLSLKEMGLRQPISVVKMGEHKYRIIDGHRRFECAKLLGWKSLRAEIHPESNEGDIKRVRFDLQNNRRPWKPLERSKEVKEIKETKGFKTNKELAEYLHFSENLLSVSLKLQKERDKYQELMDEYDLSNSYQVEFVRLAPKIRPIRDLSEKDIMKILLKRVKYKIINSAKDFRKLSSVFRRSQTFEGEIYKFLKNEDMGVEEIYSKVERSGYISDVEELMEEISKRRSQGLAFEDSEQKVTRSFFNLLRDTFKFSSQD